MTTCHDLCTEVLVWRINDGQARLQLPASLLCVSVSGRLIKERLVALVVVNVIESVRGGGASGKTVIHVWLVAIVLTKKRSLDVALPRVHGVDVLVRQGE